MKLHLLEQVVDAFLKHEVLSDHTAWYPGHSIVGTFHSHWSPPQPGSLRHMYEDCLRSDISQRWWKRDQYRPKEIMLRLIDADPELATIAWKDLANEAASLEGRLDRFDYYCNDLLQMSRQRDTRFLESHHHQDAAMISLYLAGMYPDTYALYPGLERFRSFCISVGRPDIPVVDDLVRYMKVAKVVFTYLTKNELFDRVLAHRAGKQHKVTCIPFQMSYECISFEVGSSKSDRG